MLEHMEQMHNSGYKDVAPNTVVYNNVILAYARSHFKEKAEYAMELLQSMKEQYERGNNRLRPDVITHNSVLHACAASSIHGLNTSQKRKVLFIASNVFKTMKVSIDIKPTSYSYVLYLKACGNLIPVGKTRTDLLRKVFILCGEDGMVNREVVHQIQLSCSPILANDLLAEFSPK